ncbi:4Fe-4S binding protein [Bacteroides gallinarum]|uniref:4Fe-4S binding protein n=1 Tax=Bacteroides gallinarum TaxID=376806 RepID=UPI00037A375F|nr:4Fe-4S binding protein [Bacteroides gallinarum]
MLRIIRLTLAIIFFAIITLLFLDFTGTLHVWFGWLAKIQFVPAVLALNAGIVLLLVVLTLLCGRIYCSVICPLGVFQDIVSRFAGKRKKNRFRYSPARKWLRYGMLALFAVALIAGVRFHAVASLLEPYSSYGRIASNLFAPVYQWGNNLLAHLAERADSYAFYETDVWLKSLSTFIIAAVTFIVLIVLAWRGGRTYCNTICPVGTVLGFLSRYSLFKPVIDTSKCNGCGLCARNCKASCIDSKAHEIDYSRCVACMDCLDKCKRGAITYTRRRKANTVKAPAGGAAVASGRIDDTRRAFLSATAVLATTTALKAQEKKVDGGLAVIEDKKIPARATAIVPPGALSARNFALHCTACQLCVSVCPNQVLHPSSDLMKLMQPEMSYERGYCRPECTKCSEVCPAGAIHPITKADKSAIQIGHAVWIKENCICITDDMECGNCARHCPVSAIQMVASDPDNPDSRKIPVVNTERCIGCGACENLCPSRPFSAIYVEGHIMHRTV